MLADLRERLQGLGYQFAIPEADGEAAEASEAARLEEVHLRFAGAGAGRERGMAGRLAHGFAGANPGFGSGLLFAGPFGSVPGRIGGYAGGDFSATGRRGPWFCRRQPENRHRRIEPGGGFV